VTRGALGLVAAALLLAGCSRAVSPVRLRHEPRRAFTWTLSQDENAPHPVFGVGGEVTTVATLGLSCVGADADGAGQYEVTVRGLRLTAPAAAGFAVDTAAKGPVPGDKVGATPVVLSLLPRHAMVRVSPSGAVRGAISDAEAVGHVRAWARSRPAAAQGAIRRLSEAIDAGPSAERWFGAVAALLPQDPNVSPGATWTAAPPPLETPGGRVRAELEVTYTRPDLRTAVLTARGKFALDGDAPPDAALAFREGTLDSVVTLDLGAGTIVSCEERGRLEFVVRGEGATPAPWRWTRKLSSGETR